MQAGFRREEALTIFFGVRVAFALALFAVFATSIFTRPNITLALGGLGLGYLLPGIVLVLDAVQEAGWPRSIDVYRTPEAAWSSSDLLTTFLCVSSASSAVKFFK